MDVKKNAEKNRNTFECEKCHFACSKQSNYNKHLLTEKHTKQVHGNKKMPKSADIIICECGKKYLHHSGLWRHKKICKYTTNNSKDEDVTSYKNMINELIKTNSELQKQLVEICKNSNINNTTTINNNSNNNNNNKTFNLQFFLNEQCKDAMNISDFVNSFELQLDDLESVGNLGYVEGITKQFLDKLNGMDIYKRPMHCSDAKRETIYIKDENKWEKEERNNPKLRKAIKTVSFNNLKLVVKWSDTYPESKNNESRLNDKYVKLVKQTTGGNGEISDNEDKIIRRIAKEIIIDKV
jgi:hypothetical protein